MMGGRERQGGAGMFFLFADRTQFATWPFHFPLAWSPGLVMIADVDKAHDEPEGPDTRAVMLPLVLFSSPLLSRPLLPLPSCISFQYISCFSFLNLRRTALDAFAPHLRPWGMPGTLPESLQRCMTSRASVRFATLHAG